jgi:hypothetical protein
MRVRTATPAGSAIAPRLASENQGFVAGELRKEQEGSAAIHRNQREVFWRRGGINIHRLCFAINNGKFLL